MSNTNKDRDIFIDEYMLNRLTETFKALSDYNRLRILELLYKGEASVAYYAYIKINSIKCIASIKEFKTSRPR